MTNVSITLLKSTHLGANKSEGIELRQNQEEKENQDVLTLSLSTGLGEYLPIAHVRVI